MANTGFKGIDVRQTGSQIIFRALMQTSAGALETTGPVVFRIGELQSDGNLKSYDFSDNTFKTGTLTTPTLSATHRQLNNNTVNTGYWTAVLSTLTGFTVGGVYVVFANDASASPTDQGREFIYGSAEGDLKTTAGATGIAYLQDDVTYINADTSAAANMALAFNGTGYFNATGPAQQQQVTNIAVTSAALNTVATSAVYTTGTDTGGVANTKTLDGVFDSVADTAGTTDFYYQFDLSATLGSTAVGINWYGYLAGVVNTMKVYAYNWGAAGWDQIGTINGISGVLVASQDWDLTTAHTGTGGNLGLVRIRFNNTGLTASSMKTDRILVGYAVVSTYQSADVGATATKQSYADTLLTRDWTSTVSAVGQPPRRSLMQGARKLVNHIDTTTTPGTLTVMREDDTTAGFTQTVTTNSSAQLITVLN